MKKRTNIIWKISKQELEQIVKNNDSISKILILLGVRVKSYYYEALRKRLDEDNINYSHIPKGSNCNKGKKLFREKTPLKNILIEKSTYNRCHLKARLLNEKILDNKCLICGQLPIWNNKQLIMILDHKNGIYNDNRIENLRMLCPNCNSQQDTFCRGVIRKVDKQIKNQNLCICGKLKYKKAKTCRECFKKRIIKLKITKEELKKLLLIKPMTSIGKMFGISNNAIKKKAKVFNLI
jgi:hypothetical protein